MEVTNILKKSVNSVDLNILNLPETTKKITSKSKNGNETANSINSRQQNIILNTIEKLENTQQLENNHPLSKIQNAPIDTYEEALNELNYIKSPLFKYNASAAQANVNAHDIASLFTEN